MLLPQKLDSDSKLHSERSKSILSVPEIDCLPKSSVSDSKLAVDYFGANENETLRQNSSPQSLPIVATDSNSLPGRSTKTLEAINISDSRHSLSAQSDSDDKFQKEVIYNVKFTRSTHNLKFTMQFLQV